MKSIWQYFRPVTWRPLAEKAYAAVPERIRAQPLVRMVSERVLDQRFFTDALFRTKCMLYPGFAANLLYAVMQLVLGICYRSIWSGALAVYYALLAMMRLQLLKPGKGNPCEESVLSELRQYRLCGSILLGMTPVFASILILVVHKNSGTRYPGFSVVIMEVYTACMVLLSASNLVRFRKYNRPAMSAAKIVSLIAALMSVLSLTTALAGRTGNLESDSVRQGVIGTVGGTVCVTVLCIAVYMVAHASRQFKTLRTNQKWAAVFQIRLTNQNYDGTVNTIQSHKEA